MNPYKNIDENTLSSLSPFSYEDIASKLLKDHYYLTALELHTELVENGKELPQLREFFSNPGNFEQTATRHGESSSLYRTPSQATLDSLDTTRYSEDGGGDRAGSGGDVAVLEFELRKAKETINSLRANLTQFVDEQSTLDISIKDLNHERTLKPHEKRALNFLVNEYLLLQGYKLTSITFSDENPDQDFEDWDDVGLNMPRLSALDALFLGKSNKITSPSNDMGIQTQMSGTDHECQTDHESNEENVWSHEIHVQAEEIQLLKQKLIDLETDKLNYQKLYDAAIVSLNALSTPISDTPIELKIPQEKLKDMPLPSNASENHYGSEYSTNSATPEQFEIIENYRVNVKKDNSANSSFATNDTYYDSPLRRGSAATLDEAFSLNETGDWAKVNQVSACRETWMDCSLPTIVKDSILTWCNESISKEPLSHDLLVELIGCNDKPITANQLLHLVAETLPRLIPHTLVSKRCESVALLVCTIHLLSSDDSNKRARLLQLLLNLLKKPNDVETRIICEAACLLVKLGISGELLSSVADLLSSKSSERKTLAAQICLSIAPYVPSELSTSLLLSLIQVMCECSENDVRSYGVKAACVVCPIAEHKYGQLEGILFASLKDPYQVIVKDALDYYVPLMARSALFTAKLASDFCPKIQKNLTKAFSEKDWKTAILYISILKNITHAIIVYIINVNIVKEYKNCDKLSDNIPLSDIKIYILDLQCYVNGDFDAKRQVLAMNCLLNDAPDTRWEELDWFTNFLKEILETCTENKIINQPNVYIALINLFACYVDSLKVDFAKSVLRPIFLEHISALEESMEKLQAVNVDSTIVVGVYLAAILPSIGAKDVEEFLQKWIMYSSIRSLPVKVLEPPLKWLSIHKPDSLDVCLKCIYELTINRSNSSSSVPMRIFISNLLSELLNSVDVSQSCMETRLTPTVEALLRDDDVLVREHAITTWGCLTRCIIKLEYPEERSWQIVQELLLDRELGVKETARAAECLALLVLPVQGNAVCQTAISLLCYLCHRSPLTNESLSALTPGLQLVAHHAREHPSLLPALRKLEDGTKSPGLSQYKAAVDALIHNVVGTTEVTSSPRETRQANLQTAQEVGRRVTQMFQSKTNLPSLFKKKT